MSVILDASAALALLFKEKGSDEVVRYLDDATISSVNLAEVCAKYAERGLDPARVAPFLASVGVGIVAFQAQHAQLSGQLRLVTRSHGLSLGDRACLATAMVEKRQVLTADQAWVGLDLGVSIILIR